MLYCDEKSVENIRGIWGCVYFWMHSSSGDGLSKHVGRVNSFKKKILLRSNN